MEHKFDIPLADRVLDAAEVVVVRQGIGNLTIDAVAAQAGLSKGGLLHHFPSKDRLIEAMVTRCAEEWLRYALEAREKAAPGPGRMARALLGHLADTQSWTDQCQQRSAAVFVALAQNPTLIEPMRRVYAEIGARLHEDGLAPGVGETVIAAMDGLWLYRVLGLREVEQGLMDRIRLVLEPLVARAPAAPRNQKPSRPRVAPAATARRTRPNNSRGSR